MPRFSGQSSGAGRPDRGFRSAVTHRPNARNVLSPDPARPRRPRSASIAVASRFCQVRAQLLTEPVAPRRRAASQVMSDQPDRVTASMSRRTAPMHRACKWLASLVDRRRTIDAVVAQVGRATIASTTRAGSTSIVVRLAARNPVRRLAGGISTRTRGIVRRSRRPTVEQHGHAVRHRPVMASALGLHAVQANGSASPSAERSSSARTVPHAWHPRHAGLPSIAVVSPWAILISVPWFTVHAVLCVTASTSPAADGWPLPLFFTPPNGRCTSAPMHGRFT